MQCAVERHLHQAVCHLLAHISIQALHVRGPGHSLSRLQMVLGGVATQVDVDCSQAKGLYTVPLVGTQADVVQGCDTQ